MSKCFTFFTHFLYQNPLVIILQVNIKINKTKKKQKNFKKEQNKQKTKNWSICNTCILKRNKNCTQQDLDVIQTQSTPPPLICFLIKPQKSITRSLDIVKCDGDTCHSDHFDPIQYGSNPTRQTQFFPNLQWYYFIGEDI